MHLGWEPFWSIIKKKTSKESSENQARTHMEMAAKKHATMDSKSTPQLIQNQCKNDTEREKSKLCKKCFTEVPEHAKAVCKDHRF